MDSSIKRLIDSGAIICGKIINDNGIIRFEKCNNEEIENIPEEKRGYATISMGRAIFSISEDGKIHNFKGVDSQLSLSALSLKELLSNYYEYQMPGDDKYKLSIAVFKDGSKEIRINGSAPLEDIEIEGDLNPRLANIGIKVPKICYLREITQEYSVKYGLPIKIDGSLDEFVKCDYAKEDDERKKRLRDIYGDNYSESIEENHRPETMKEYLVRIGFFSSEVINKLQQDASSIDDFIVGVDNSYSRGQRYGQSERIMENPFRISDLAGALSDGNNEMVQAIMSFSQIQYEKTHNEGSFAEDMAESFGKNIAIFINNGWLCENLTHRQDFTLAGEFCDDAYFNIFEKKQEFEEKNNEEPDKVKGMMAETEQRYIAQVMHLASCIKTVQEAMNMIGKSHEEIDRLLKTFVDSFVTNLEFDRIGELLSFYDNCINDEESVAVYDENHVKTSFIEDFFAPKNWVEYMSEQFRGEERSFQKAIYNLHTGNEYYYDKVSEMISECIKDRDNRQKSKNGLKDCFGDSNLRIGCLPKSGDLSRGDGEEIIIQDS